MNRFENWFCSSSFWRGVTRRRLLPWLLEGMELGEHILEIGAGAGAATQELRKRAARVTSLEYSRDLVVKLAAQNKGEDGKTVADVDAVQGDASALPFPDKTFSSVLAVLMLHHLTSREAQDQSFAEVFRVLQPGGVFVALDITDGWLNRVAHIRSTFVPIALSTATARLVAAGFSNVTIEFRSGAFRLRAFRAKISASA
jgi:ubiquinone/menaquinone biosynthesis C-methylase UbiE